MLINKDIFIEVDCRQIESAREAAQSNIYFQKRHEDNIITVLCDGGDSCIEAHIKASMAASMAINSQSRDIIDIAKTIVDFVSGDTTIPFSFTIIRIYKNLRVEIIEYKTPQTIILYKKKLVNITRTPTPILNNQGEEVTINKCEFKADEKYLIVSFSNGVLESGRGSLRMPEGWSNKQIALFLQNCINTNISARFITDKLIKKALGNELFAPKKDISTSAIYIRHPRKVLVCTGPPYNQADDPKLAQIVNDYDGDVILSGGTTASIIARELNREINVVLQKRNTGVPSKSEIKGISLVTEGVLTLGKVKERLMETKDGVFKGTSPDIEIIHSLLEHDIIEFVVGMKINTMHQNPNIPVELALRRNVVKDIAHELREKFMKEVTMKFI
ncbi:MAG: hypothetical protein RR363_05210 [Rikenellaceae bacterium]